MVMTLQVEELKGTFGGLKLDVEAMFMQMPSVDLDELGSQLEAMQQHQQVSTAISCHITSCRVVSCHVVSCRVVSCRVMSCHVVSCHVM